MTSLCIRGRYTMYNVSDEDTILDIALNYPNHSYVYSLADDIDIVFYVGKGKKRRIFYHEKLSDGYPSEKAGRIKELQDNGKYIHKTLIALFEEEKDAYLYEYALLFLMPQLTNKVRSALFVTT